MYSDDQVGYSIANCGSYVLEDNVTFSTCPWVDNLQILVSAGRANLDASVGSPDPVLPVGRQVFNGRTGGVIPMGPDGISYLSDLSSPPPGISRPAGFSECKKFRNFRGSRDEGVYSLTGHPYNLDYTYMLTQNGATADVKCLRRTPDMPVLANISANPYLDIYKLEFYCGASPGKSAKCCLWSLQSVIDS